MYVQRGGPSDHHYTWGNLSVTATACMIKRKLNGRFLINSTFFCSTLLRLLSPVHPVDNRRSRVDFRRSKVDFRRSKVDIRRRKVDIRRSKVDRA